VHRKPGGLPLGRYPAFDTRLLGAYWPRKPLVARIIWAAKNASLVHSGRRQCAGDQGSARRWVPAPDFASGPEVPQAELGTRALGPALVLGRPRSFGYRAVGCGRIVGSRTGAASVSTSRASLGPLGARGECPRDRVSAANQGRGAQSQGTQAASGVRTRLGGPRPPGRGVVIRQPVREHQVFALDPLGPGGRS
jgi:hypothetical protein